MQSPRTQDAAGLTGDAPDTASPVSSVLQGRSGEKVVLDSQRKHNKVILLLTQ
jgi:hypothetical protein